MTALIAFKSSTVIFSAVIDPAYMSAPSMYEELFAWHHADEAVKFDISLTLENPTLPLLYVYLSHV